MKKYRIMNIITRVWWEGKAHNPSEAYRKTGWAWRDCRITEHSEKGAGGWKKVEGEEKGKCLKTN